MPKLIAKKSAPPHCKPAGKLQPSAAVPKSEFRLFMEAQRKPGTDDVEISPPLPVGETVDVTGATLADAASLVQKVSYLVRGWVPFGMVTGIIAEPGVGKSAFALYGLARPIITGCDWFTGDMGPREPGPVLWCGTENDTAITLDRATKWGIPIDRIRLLFKDDPLRPVDLTNASHLEQIEAQITRHRIKAVFIDSLRSGHDRDENSSQVGRVLQRLAEIAERTKAAIIIIHHTKKIFPGEGITANSSRGSNAITAMIRALIGIDWPDPNGKWCRVRVLKENLGLAPTPIGFQVTHKGLEFGPAPQRPRRETEKGAAEDWLRANMLPGRWYPSREIDAGLAAAGFSGTAGQRAKVALGMVKPNVRKTAQGWECRLPVAGAATGTNNEPGRNP